MVPSGRAAPRRRGRQRTVPLPPAHHARAEAQRRSRLKRAVLRPGHSRTRRALHRMRGLRRSAKDRSFSPEDHAHSMGLTIVDEWYARRALRQRLAIKLGVADAPIDAARIFHGDLVARRAMS